MLAAETNAPPSAELAAESAAKPALKWGVCGAGGHSNASNFSEALRVSTVAAGDVVFPSYLNDRIKMNAEILPVKVPEKGGKTFLQPIIWDIAEWLVNSFGVQPRTACPNIVACVDTLAKALLPSAWHIFHVGSMVGSRSDDFKRCGMRATHSSTIRLIYQTYMSDTLIRFL